MTDHATNLEQALSKPNDAFKPGVRAATFSPSLTKPTDTRAEATAVEEIALKILHLEYIEMMELAEELHSVGQTVGDSAPATAKRLHDWALHKLEKKNLG